MMVKNIMYGTEDNVSYFVQSCCSEEHLGQECDCIQYGSYLSENRAMEEASKLAGEFNVPLIRV